MTGSARIAVAAPAGLAASASTGLAVAVAVGLAVDPVHALAHALPRQQDTSLVAPGVELGVLYETEVPRPLVVRPFHGGDPAGAAGAIVARDLELSDRFAVLGAPASLADGPPDFEMWDGLSVDYVVDGEVDRSGGDPVLRVTVHDVLYARVLQRRDFALPPARAPAFRMAVHQVSDAILRWITGQPGMAASRVAFVRRREDGGTDVLVVDSDGEGVRRVAGTEGLALSPAWSPDGTRIVHTELTPEGTNLLLERNLATGGTRDLSPRPELKLTPAYAPDGSRIALAISTGPREDLHELDLASGELRRVAASAMAPGYSPDGRFLAFGSDRLGTPHVWMVDRDGGDPVLLSPYGAGERSHFELPDWSPVGSLLAFHGGTAFRYQVLVLDPSDPERRVRQITREGWSESPSWAPDGRHLVVHGSREGRVGLYVLDTRTGRTRLLVGGANVRTPDWSPRLGNEGGAP